MTNHDQFDELVDYALSEYRDAEPLSGLEDRVLQRLQPVGRRFAWWMWGAIAICAALVLIGVWIGVENPTTPHLPTDGKYGPPTSTQPTQAREQASPPISSPESKELARVTKTPTPPKTGGAGHPARTTIVTQRVFPTPTPLTAQERAFMASLQGNSAVAASGAAPDSSIAIAEIQIKPLTATGQSLGGDQ
jgi:hypothetical protein